MAHHSCYCIALADNGDGTVNAVSSVDGDIDVLTVPPGKTALIVDSIAGPMGLTFTNLTPAGGDTIAVTGPLGEIPDWQVGLFFSVDDNGRAYFTCAGHLAQQFSFFQPTTTPAEDTPVP
jgi:hypothetical protein